jgi:DNA-binding YbaB/EbfC family protein
MFDMKKIAQLQQELQSNLAKVQEDLKTRTVEGTAGGGLVKATASGAKELVRIKIEPDAVDPDDLEMLEDLVVAAVNNALEEAKKLHEKEVSRVTGGLTGGMNLPGLF